MEHQTLGEGLVNIYINTPERGYFNKNNSMDTRSVWERSYEDDYVSLLNESGVPEAAYEGLVRNSESMRSISMENRVNIPRESIERRVESIARIVVQRTHKYVRTHYCIEISVSIDRLNRRS